MRIFIFTITNTIRLKEIVTYSGFENGYNVKFYDEFDVLDKSEIVAYRKEDYQFKVLVKDRNKAAKQYPNAIVGPTTIEEIMLFYVKGEMK